MLTKNAKDHAIIVLICAAVLASTTIVLEALSRGITKTESIDRQYSTYVADADVGFLNKPHSVSRGASGTGEFQYEYRHNSMGFRDGEHAAAKPPGVFRILGLGDSFTYGAGAGFNEIYLTVLGKRLSSAARPVEVINAATTFSWPAMEHKVFEKYGKRFSPDLVIVGFLPNDIIDTKLSSLAVTVGADGYLKRDGADMGFLGRWFHAHSSLWKRMQFSLFQFKSRIYWKDIYAGFFLTDDAWSRIEADFLALKKSVARIGAQLVIVYIPQQGPWRDYHRKPEARLLKWAEVNGVLVIPTFDAFRKAEAAGEKLFYVANGHCTPAGHRVVAEAIAAKLHLP